MLNALTGADQKTKEIQEFFEQEQGVQETFFTKMFLTSYLLFKSSWNLLSFCSP
jgi:hypothetical protein